MAHPSPDSSAQTFCSLPERFADLAGAGYMRRLLELARDEDLGSPPIDLTSRAGIPADAELTANLAVRGACVVAGVAAVPMMLEVFAEAGFGSVRFEPRAIDGQAVEGGEVLGTLAGNARSVLAVERTMLNLVSRLSGVATLTRTYVEKVAGTKARLYDTRKTTPGLRHFEKYAVCCGGGHSHRLGLHDAVLLKDNHLSRVAEQDVGDWIRRSVAGLAADPTLPRASFVMVEVDSLAMLEQVLPVAEVGIVLLDNMGVADLERAVGRRDAVAPGIQLEASGGVTLKTIGDIARTGVDRISVGALTHQALSVDIGLDASGE